MVNKRGKINSNLKAVEIIVHDIHSEIDLGREQLLKLELDQMGSVMICTSGTVWLTQQDDLSDHLLKTGQAFCLDRRGLVLVQGLPRGKVLIHPPNSEGVVDAINQPTSRICAAQNMPV